MGKLTNQETQRLLSLLRLTASKMQSLATNARKCISLTWRASRSCLIWSSLVITPSSGLHWAACALF